MANNRVNQLFTSIADTGWELIRGRLSLKRRRPEMLCRDLLSMRGEASGAALAREVVDCYKAMGEEARLAFFRTLAETFEADPERIGQAVDAYRKDPSSAALARLRQVAEPPRLELFRRMNMAPDGVRSLVRLRADLLGFLAEHPELKAVDHDLHELMTTWFNPGFLTLRRIDWESPASLLEKLMRSEQVHRMDGLEGFKRRLAGDRRCFAFFHPTLPDEPLIFVQVALVEGMAASIRPLVDSTAEVGDVGEADTAIFYSISNCQPGLRGVSLGSFLIKLVVDDLARELPEIRTYATLSPVPGFRAWLDRARGEGHPLIGPNEAATLSLLDEAAWFEDGEKAASLKPLLRSLCAHYLVREKRDGRPLDPVARFHLGNGARLERINWAGDLSAKGLAESAGLLVNYRYDLSHIERNHEQYANHGEVVVSSSVRGLLPGEKAMREGRARVEAEKDGTGKRGKGDGAVASG